MLGLADQVNHHFESTKFARTGIESDSLVTWSGRRRLNSKNLWFRFLVIFRLSTCLHMLEGVYFCSIHLWTFSICIIEYRSLFNLESRTNKSTILSSVFYIGLCVALPHHFDCYKSDWIYSEFLCFRYEIVLKKNKVVVSKQNIENTPVHALFTALTTELGSTLHLNRFNRAKSLIRLRSSALSARLRSWLFFS